MQLRTRTFGRGGDHLGLVQGLGADGGTWQPLVDRLVSTELCTVTTVDLRGHGLSDRAQACRLDDFAQDVVDALPGDLDGVMGHSLGGVVLERAVDRLRPRYAVYLDPGFHLTLPTTGIAGRLFWSAPALTLGAAGLLQSLRSARVRGAYDATTRGLLQHARKRFDVAMAPRVVREVAFHPLTPVEPVVPSVIVLSDESPSVLPDDVADVFEEKGWEIRRLSGLHHDMHLEDPALIATLILELLRRPSP